MIKTLALMVSVVALASAAVAADAPPAPVRNIVQTFPASGAPGQQVSLATVTFAPGAKIAFHTHPGEETGVVLSGVLLLEVEGKPPLTLKPGDSYLVPRGVAHQASAPQGETRVVATFVVDKDKPLATPRP